MSPSELLDYSSWLFQAVMIAAILYLVVGLIQPSWVLATKRSTIVVVSVAVMLIASTVFYLTVRDLPGALITPEQLNEEPA
jgi:hypothetical protein